MNNDKLTSIKEAIMSDDAPDKIIKEHGVHHMNEPYRADQNISEAKHRAQKMAEVAGAISAKMGGVTDFTTLAANEKELEMMIRNMERAFNEFCDYSGVRRYY